MCPVAWVWGPMDSDARIRVYYICFLMELSLATLNLLRRLANMNLFN